MDALCPDLFNRTLGVSGGCSGRGVRKSSLFRCGAFPSIHALDRFRFRKFYGPFSRLLVPFWKMTLDQWINTYGYWAILLGTFLEGETILILGGLAAYQGYLKLPWVILIAFLGTVSGDQLSFYLGRKYGSKVLASRPAWQVRAKRVRRLLERYQDYLILLFRFLYGLRILTPFVLGLSRVSRGRFLLLNTVGALVWAIIVGIGAFLFGQALEALIGDLKRFEVEILGLVVLVGTVIWVIHGYRRRRSKASSH